MSDDVLTEDERKIVDKWRKHGGSALPDVIDRLAERVRTLAEALENMPLCSSRALANARAREALDSVGWKEKP